MSEGLREEVIRLFAEHPEARVVTDGGATMISGWVDLIRVEWLPDHNAIELEFA